MSNVYNSDLAAASGPLSRYPRIRATLARDRPEAACGIARFTGRGRLRAGCPVRFRARLAAARPWRPARRARRYGGAGSDLYGRGFKKGNIPPAAVSFVLQPHRSSTFVVSGRAINTPHNKTPWWRVLRLGESGVGNEYGPRGGTATASRVLPTPRTTIGHRPTESSASCARKKCRVSAPGSPHT